MYASMSSAYTDGGAASGGSTCWLPMRTNGFCASGERRYAADALDDAPRRAAQARIALVSRLRERGGGGFTQDGACAARNVLVRRVLAAELEQVFRILVFGEQPEQARAARG